MLKQSELNGTNPVAAYEVASGVTIAEGNLVCLDSDGKAVNGADTAGLKLIGVAVAMKGTAVQVAGGIVQLPHTGLTRAMRGKPAFVNGSAALANATSNYVAAGIVVDVDADGAWVDTRPQAIAAARAGAAAAALTSGGMSAGLPNL